MFLHVKERASEEECAHVRSSHFNVLSFLRPRSSNMKTNKSSKPHRYRGRYPQQRKKHVSFHPTDPMSSLHTRAHANKITDTMKSNYRSVHVFVNGQQSHSVCVCLGVGGLQLEGFYQLFSHPESSVILTNCCPYTLAVITGPCH